jgi:hypothetical protein
MRLSDLSLNPDNPRDITQENIAKLADSIKKFPKMMRLRPIVTDDSGMTLGGNARLKALEFLGYDEIPDEWVVKASELTPQEQKRFIIQDNIAFGRWDNDILANDWNIEDLSDWGLDLPDLAEYKATKDIPDLGDVQFSENLLLEHNYVVLYFDNPMDWEVAMAKFGLKKAKTQVPDKSQKVGIGRVIEGKRFL